MLQEKWHTCYHVPECQALHSIPEIHLHHFHREIWAHSAFADSHSPFVLLVASSVAASSDNGANELHQRAVLGHAYTCVLIREIPTHRSHLVMTINLHGMYCIFLAMSDAFGHQTGMDSHTQTETRMHPDGVRCILLFECTS
jgi:hypothetical protein